MQELSRFEGIIIKMYYNDDGKHHKPHIHVLYGDDEAQIGLDGEILSGKLPTNKYKLVAAWLVLHEDELYAAWNNAVRNLPVAKINPLA
ncbi:MAG: DUF4160 domain-containing protein [Coriobacteriales bacterium]|nr:DUF4160 domain-containing protein [Coriobacteriales bacterium]